MAITFDDIDPTLLRTYEEIISSYYLELDPTADVANGSVIHELVIRPAAAIYARNEVALEDLRNQYSLNLLATAAAPDDTIANNLAANFRVTRRAGVPAAGTIAVYTRQTNNIYVNRGATFTAANLALVCNDNYVGVLDDTGLEDTDTVKYRKMVSVGGGEYAFLVPVTTTAGTTDSAAEGTPVTQTAPNALISRIEVASAVTGGTAQETVAEMTERVAHGVTAKVPSGAAHIEALISEQTTIAVQDVVTIGMGNPEMLRDRNNIFLVSVGGRVDVYCRTAQLPATSTVEVAATTADGTNWTMFLERDLAQGWYYITKIAHASNSRVVTGPDSIAVEFLWEQEEDGPEVFSGLTARYSPYQTARATFAYPGLSGSTANFLVSLVHMPQLEDLQEFINSPSIRNRQQDCLIKAPVPVYVGMNLSLRCLDDPESVDAGAVAATISTYVNTLPMGRGFLNVADLAVLIGTTYSNLVLDFPATLASTCYMPDGSILRSETREGTLTMPEDLALGVSARNTAFFCRPTDIALTVRTQ